MTRLQRVSVEGFKAIDSLEFQPGAINIVTGRNNSGKTSLLEAIDLGVQPSHVNRFGENLRSVINYRYEESQITVDAGESVTELQIFLPKKFEAANWILGATREFLYENWNAFAVDDMDRKRAIEIIDDEFPTFFDKHVDHELLESAIEQSIGLKANGKDYPYIFPEGKLINIYGEIYKNLKNHVRSEFGRDMDHYGEISSVTFNTDLPDLSGFISGSPSKIGSTRFIDFVQLSKPLKLDSGEDDPVKIDDISDFLREKEIVDNLKTFDLDYLIFEDEDGEKYSVPFAHMGEGFKTIVGVLWHLLGIEGSVDIVLLEEPNTHMHPGYVRELTYFIIDLAREENIQLFITTHNSDFINDFFTENLKPKEKAFLEEEFRLIQLQDGAADVMDYEEAEKQLKDLQLDLRGYR